MHGSEEDGPDGVADLLESDGALFEKAADEDLSALPPKGAVPRDPSDLEMTRIMEGLGSFGEGSVRGVMDGRRGLHLQRLMGSLVVIDSTELVEPTLL